MKSLGIIIALGSLLAVPAAPDSLMLHAGQRLETVGPWSISGPLVVFTRTDGMLSSIRIGDVDLKASRAAGESEPPAPAAPVPVPRRSVLVLTDEDIPKATESSESVRAKPSSSRFRPSASPLKVDFWAEIKKGDDLEIAGLLHNRGASSERFSGVVVEISNREGGSIHSALASTDDALLDPGASTKFRARFYGVGKHRWRTRFRVETDPILRNTLPQHSGR